MKKGIKTKPDRPVMAFRISKEAYYLYKIYKEKINIPEIIEREILKIANRHKIQ